MTKCFARIEKEIPVIKSAAMNTTAVTLSTDKCPDLDVYVRLIRKTNTYILITPTLNALVKKSQRRA